MLCVETILVGPEEKGKIISLTNVEKVELELTPGTAGYEYSASRSAFVGFVVRPNMKELKIFPGYGGVPGKNGQKSYVTVMPNQFESVESTDGSGLFKHGLDGYVKVKLYIPNMSN